MDEEADAELRDVAKQEDFEMPILFFLVVPRPVSPQILDKLPLILSQSRWAEGSRA